MKINKEHLSWLVEYTKERSSVYYKKEILKESPPWTNFEELKWFKFTNVKRILDRETKWSIKNILNNAELTSNEKALNVALFIIINSGKSIEFYLNGPVRYSQINNLNEVDFFNTLRVYEECKYNKPGAPNYVNPAYFLSGVAKVANCNCSESNKYHLTGKAEFIWKYKKYIIDAWNSNTFEEAFNNIKNIPSFRNFLGYQALTTMSYSSDTKFTDDDFILCGPGTLGGLSYLFDDYNDYYNSELLIEYLRCHIKDICKEYHLSWDIEKWLHFLPENQRYFTRQDWTNSMCELNKLCKLRYGVSMRRRYYRPQ